MKRTGMKREKRDYVRIFSAVSVCMLLLCTGCAAGNGETLQGGSTEGDTKNSIFNDAITDSGEKSEKLPGPEADFGNSSEASSEAETGITRELTAAERKQFTDFANRPENNGFLLSQYDNAAGADLNQIFYNGAGMDSQPLSEEEQAAYEAAGYPVETDITRLTSEQIDTFLRQKTGIGMEDMTGRLDWVYLEDSDSYVFQHGDTNFCTFVCTGGTRTGEFCELRFKAAGDYVSDCVTTLAKKGEDYRFVSNCFSENTDDQIGRASCRERV